MTKELDSARARLESVARRLSNIATLPQYEGDQVQWVHNGCVWTRLGDDRWEGEGGDPFPSDHVAGFEYKHLSRPTPEPEEPAEPTELPKLGTEVTPLMVATFKAAWGVADALGAQGRRVEAGLHAVLLLLQDQAATQAPTPEPDPTRVRMTVSAGMVVVGDILEYTLDSAEVLAVRRGVDQAEFRLSDRPGWSVYPWGSKVTIRRVVS